jgi:hypothetical protein
MVLRLAESPGLSLRERNEVLLTAGYAPVYSESRRSLIVNARLTIGRSSTYG